MVSCYSISIRSNVTIQASVCFLLPELYIIGSTSGSECITTMFLEKFSCFSELIRIVYFLIKVYHIYIIVVVLRSLQIRQQLYRISCIKDIMYHPLAQRQKMFVLFFIRYLVFVSIGFPASSLLQELSLLIFRQ